jgi:hypothetical protein
MRRELTRPERDLLLEVVERHGGDRSLASALQDQRLTDDDRRRLGDLATEELAYRGFDVDYRPNAVGSRLEEIIDVLGPDA